MPETKSAGWPWLTTFGGFVVLCWMIDACRWSARHDGREVANMVAIVFFATVAFSVLVVTIGVVSSKNCRARAESADKAREHERHMNGAALTKIREESSREAVYQAVVAEFRQKYAMFCPDCGTTMTLTESKPHRAMTGRTATSQPQPRK